MNILPSMLAIKPIETHYNGYKFRSRLEARWAVFFDALGFQYRYEPEGFNLGDGIWYLPDFSLFNGSVYAEIKPTYPLLARDCEKAIRLCVGKQQIVMFFAGDVWPDAHKVIVYTPIVDEHYRERLENAALRGLPVHWRSHNQAIVLPETLIDAVSLGRGYEAYEALLVQCLNCSATFFLWTQITCKCHESDIDLWKVDDMTPRLMSAYTAARQARFERRERS